jgi:recombination protein RecT
MSRDLVVQGRNVVDSVALRVKDLVAQGNIELPVGYSAQNALKSAYLILSETVDRNKRPVLEVCTQASIANALLAMVVQGLDPATSQGYFLPYGQRLTFQRSYMGSQALAKRLNPELKEINSAVIREGETFEYELVDGKPYVTKHQVVFGSEKPIIGAYAVALNQNGELIHSEIMTIKEIHQAWKQSKQKPILDNGDVKKGSVHDKFEHEMTRRTVINRLCKKLINTSPESGVKAFVQSNEIEIVQGQLEEEVTEQANKIEFQPTEFPEVEIPSAEEIAAATEEVEEVEDENPFGEEGE